MPLEIEYDEATGKIGTLPEPIQKFVDGLIDQTGSKLRKKIEADVEAKYAEKLKAVDPAERERLKQLQEENERFKIEDAERRKKYDEAEEIRKQREADRVKEHEKAVSQKEAEIQRRDGRLRDMARSEIKIAAKNLGARTESLDELARLLGADLDLDADLQPFVKGVDGKPLVDKDGKPVTIEGHVQSYLDSHAHHRTPASGTGGGARGGASLTTSTLTGKALEAQKKVDEIQERISKKSNPTNKDIDDLFKAQKELKAATGG